MSTQVNTAVILAAGLGSRLKDRTKEQPKGFLQIDGQSLIERSVNALISRGITKIIIGTGYLHNHFDELKKKYPVIVTHRNEDFASTGSMFTLYNLRHLVVESFILLESDLLYESAALDYTINDNHQDVILASGATQSGDEVYIQASSESFLQNMSKNKAQLDHISGELVGITKISPSTFAQMVAFSEGEYDKGNKQIHYEDALVGVSSLKNIYVKVIDDLAWCEIDDEAHLTRAINSIYPRISSKK